jgi:lipoic acid synthetase
MDERPEILNHNTETVPRLYRGCGPRPSIMRSMELLQRAKRWTAWRSPSPASCWGWAKRWDEMLQVMDDLRAHDVDIMTIGQYLQPSRFHLPIERYYTPDEFARLKEEGERRGFKWMESGPLVRSSYHADGQAHLSPRRLRDWDWRLRESAETNLSIVLNLAIFSLYAVPNCRSPASPRPGQM